MKKSICLISLALFALVSCNNDSVIQSNQGSKIEFRTSMDTRAMELQQANFTEFYVTALYADGSIYFADKFVRNGSYFESATDYYWPADGKLTFFAYYPSEEALGANVNISNEAKVIPDFTPAAKVVEQLDFVTAVKIAGKEDAAAGVALDFSHQLSQIEIKGKNTNAGHTVKVKAIRIKNVANSGDFDFVGAMTNWSQSDELTSYEIVYNEAVTLGAATQTLMGSEGNAMLIPQSRPAWGVAANIEGEEATTDPNGSYIAFLIQATTESGSRIFPVNGEEYGWVAHPIGFNWAAGYKYTYNCDFSEGLGIIAPEGDDDDIYNEGDSVVGSEITVDVSYYSFTTDYYESYNNLDM